MPIFIDDEHPVFVNDEIKQPIFVNDEIKQPIFVNDEVKQPIFVDDEAISPQPIQGLAGQQYQPQLQWTPPSTPRQPEITTPYGPALTGKTESPDVSDFQVGRVINKTLKDREREPTLTEIGKKAYEALHIPSKTIKKGWQEIADAIPDLESRSVIANVIINGFADTLPRIAGELAAISTTPEKLVLGRLIGGAIPYLTKLFPILGKEISFFSRSKTLDKLLRQASQLVQEEGQRRGLSPNQIADAEARMVQATLKHLDRLGGIEKVPLKALRKGTKYLKSIREIYRKSPIGGKVSQPSNINLPSRQISITPPIPKQPIQTPSPIIKPSTPQTATPITPTQHISIPEKAETFIKAGEELAKVSPSAAEILGKTKVSKIMFKLDPFKEQKRSLRLQERISKLGFKEGYKVGSEKYNKKLAEYKELQQIILAKKKIKEDILRMAKRIKNLNTEDLPSEYKTIINNMRNKFDLKFRSSKTLFERDSMREFIKRQEELGNDILIPQEKLDLLDKTPLNDMFIGQVKELHDTVIQLAYQGRMKNRYINNKYNRTIDEYVSEASLQLEGKSDVPELKGKELISLEHKKSNFIKEGMLRQTTLSTLLEDLDNFTYGAYRKYAWNPISESESKAFTLRTKNTELTSKIYAKTNWKKLQKKISIIKGFNDRQIDEHLTIYAYTKNPHSKEILLNSGFTEKELEQAINFLKTNYPNEIELVDNIQSQVFPEIYKRIAPEFKKMTGKELGYVDMYLTVLGLNTESPLASFLEDAYYWSDLVQFGSLKPRVPHKVAFKDILPFSEIVDKYLTNASYFEAYGNNVRDVTKFLKHPKNKSLIYRNRGKKFYDEILYNLRTVAHGYDPEVKGVFDKYMRLARHNGYIYYLGGNVYSGIRATFSFPAGVNKLGEKWAMNGIATFMRNISKIHRLSPFMANRANLWSREKYALFQREGAKSRLTGKRSLKKALVDYAFFPVTFGDFGATHSLWWGAYKKVLATQRTLDGTSLSKLFPADNRGVVQMTRDDVEKIAVEEANKLTQDTQPTGTALHIPRSFKGNETEKTLTMFLNTLNKVINQNQVEFTKFNRAIGWDKVPQSAKFARSQFYLTFLPAFLMTSLGSYIAKKKGYNPASYAQNLTMQYLGGNPLLALGLGGFNNRWIVSSMVNDMKPKDFSMEEIAKSAVFATTLLRGYPRKLAQFATKPFSLGNAARITKKER